MQNNELRRKLYNLHKCWDKLDHKSKRKGQKYKTSEENTGTKLIYFFSMFLDAIQKAWLRKEKVNKLGNIKIKTTTVQKTMLE